MIEHIFLIIFGVLIIVLINSSIKQRKEITEINYQISESNDDIKIFRKALNQIEREVVDFDAYLIGERKFVAKELARKLEEAQATTYEASRLRDDFYQAERLLDRLTRSRFPEVSGN